MGKHSGGGGNRQKDDDAKHEQKFQAVLLADSFVNTFRPVSLDKPKVLCPLNNVVMLDYAMEFLAGAGVEEIFVVCTSPSVEQYVSRNTWTSTIKVVCIQDAGLTNAGDALRELDKRNLVQSDPFLLLSGDVITNVHIGPALEEHRARRKKDSSAIMTCLFKEVGGWDCVDTHDTDSSKKRDDDNNEDDNNNDNSQSQSTPKTTYCNLRPADEDLVVALSKTNRILVYDNHASRKSTQIPCSFFQAHPLADFRSDLLDCGIDICSPDVLARFSDEFDYRDIRQEFVTNLVAEEEEGLQSKIYAHLLGPSEYAARVHDFSTYAAISQDLLKRWCYPVVPDNLPSGYEREQHYALERRFLYRERKGRSRMERSSEVIGPGMIGSHCVIGADCRVERSVLGSKCHIGKNVTIRDSFLWGDVTVEDNATLVGAILAEGTVVKKGATVQTGCVLGPGVVVGEGMTVPGLTRLTTSNKTDEDEFSDDDFGDFDDEEDVEEEEDDSDEDDSEEDAEEDNDDADEKDKGTVTSGDVLVSNEAVVGKDGCGKVWQPPLDDDDDDFDDDDDEEELPPLELVKAQSVGFDRSALLRRRKERQYPDKKLLPKLNSMMDPDGVDGFDGTNNDNNNTGTVMMDDTDDGMGDFTFGTSSFAAATTTDAGTIVGRQKGVDVIKELKMICLEHEETSPVENLAIELNSFKFSQNASYSDCTEATMLAVLDRMNITADTKAGKLVSSLKARLDHWAPLLEKMSIGLDEEKAIVYGVERAAADLDSGLGATLRTEPNFRFVLQTLHDEEVISEEALLAWAAERRRSSEDEQEETVRAKLFAQEPTQDFLEWLNDDSDDDDEDDESDDEDSD